MLVVQGIWPILFHSSSLRQMDSPSIITHQLAGWQSKSHWNHVKLFKESGMFQESGSHCQSFEAVIDLQTTRGPVIVTQLPNGRGLLRLAAGNCIQTRLPWQARHHIHIWMICDTYCTHTNPFEGIPFLQTKLFHCVVCPHGAQAYQTSHLAAVSIQKKQTNWQMRKLDRYTDRQKHRQSHSHGSRHEMSNAT